MLFQKTESEKNRHYVIDLSESRALPSDLLWLLTGYDEDISRKSPFSGFRSTCAYAAKQHHLLKVIRRQLEKDIREKDRTDRESGENE